MPIYRGSTQIGRRYRGSTEIAAVYRGSTLIYQNAQPGSLDIEDSTLDVTQGGSVNMRVRLGARPRSDVTVTASVSVTGNEQSAALLPSWYNEGISNNVEVVFWNPPTGSRPSIDAALRGGDARFLGQLFLREDGHVTLGITSDQTENQLDSFDDLTGTFEQSGSIGAESGSAEVVIPVAGADVTDPYQFTGPNVSEIASFVTTVHARLGNQAGTLTLRDFNPNALTLGASSLTFTRDNWDAYQNLAVSAANTGPQSGILSLAASGPDEYDGVTGSATVAVT